MIDLTTGLLFLAVFLITTWLFSGRTYKNLPPGPKGLPFFGHIWKASGNKKFYLELAEYKKKYGNIFSMFYGSHPVVVLNGHDLIREALVTKADYFSDRPDWLVINKKLNRNNGIVWHKDDWKGMRKFALMALKDFGLGKASLEEKCDEEVNALLGEFEKTEGKPFSVQTLMPNAISNITCSIVFGNRFSYDDKEFTHMMTAMNIIFKRNGMITVPNFMPVVFPFFFIKAMFDPNSPKAHFAQMKGFVEKRIQEHKQTYDPDETRDFIDLYIQAGKTNNISEQDAFKVIIDLFFAGTETTSTTLQWLIIHMIHNPEVQRKCRQEIHEVIGTSRGPTSKDRGYLRYTEATLLELQRIANIAPLSLPHMANRDVDIAGYTIPKDAFIIPNLYSAQMDPAAWDEPHKFKPERWIGDDGKLIKHPAFMPFSLGRRQCLGEQLAKLEIFIFGVSLLQRFEFQKADKMPRLDGEQGLSLLPHNFEFRAIKH